MFILPIPALVKVLATLALALGLWNIRSVRRTTAPQNDPILICAYLAAVVGHLIVLRPHMGTLEGLFSHRLADFQVAQLFVLAVLVSGWWKLIGFVIQSGIELVSVSFARLVDLIVTETATLLRRFTGRKAVAEPAAEEA